MSWQEIAVAVIVAGAVAFLLRRFIGRRRPGTPAETFVPLSSLKSHQDDRPDKPDCH
jgi:hypothetical protein